MRGEVMPTRQLKKLDVTAPLVVGLARDLQQRPDPSRRARLLAALVNGEGVRLATIGRGYAAKLVPADGEVAAYHDYDRGRPSYDLIRLCLGRLPTAVAAVF